jgi:hypothetical protein
LVYINDKTDHARQMGQWGNDNLHVDAQSPLIDNVPKAPFTAPHILEIQGRSGTRRSGLRSVQIIPLKRCHLRGGPHDDVAPINSYSYGLSPNGAAPTKAPPAVSPGLPLTTVMSDSGEANVKNDTLEKDEAELARMGYKQELKYVFLLIWSASNAY